ncbi:QueT transporter family protein [Staphylococcus saprophyticus]|uniref:QueT transporter family protein n=1 Tax=Staphylococcus TaxID=1279 RepID=UPI0019317094|nr:MULTISPECIES: QueT transporter family protein [Staphylococcus]MBM0845835.1 QueT transporter family protein [Staphylococcus saprophyticus]MCA2501288.1 QueT transporter family protein [Staphylococcus xylosus]MDW4404491.1 QueT transporter family protein [Staphylococcus saprophyticus]UBV38766.1 QueT transporter family protein [Staphylococcus xylosus]
MSSKEITQISCIAAILSIFAMMKLPSILPGLEFQLSAPVSLLILALFGIKKYFIGGLLSSFILLILGVFNPLNLIISFCFRLVAILIVYIFKVNVFSFVIASILGSTLSRLILSQILNLPISIVMLNAIPGMIFTIILMVPLYLSLSKNSIIKKISA